MTQSLFASANLDFANNAPGKLFLFPYPTTDPGGADTPTNQKRLLGLLALLYDTDLSFKTIKTGVTPWGDVDENGFNFKVDLDELTFPRNDGNAPTRRFSSIKQATLDFEIYDADADHFADAYGLATADLLQIPAASGKAGRHAAMLGLPNTNQYWVAILQMRSGAFSGEFDHFICPRVNFMTKPDIKYSQKDKILLKTQLNCLGDKWLVDSQGIRCYGMPVTTNAAATA